MVFIEHWGFALEQVPAQQLWFQVPDLPHDVPHDGLFSAELCRDCVDEDGADADGAIAASVPEDRGAGVGLLCLRGEWERVAAIPAGLLQPGDRRDDALLHRGVRLHHDREEGDVADVCGARSCSCWRRHRQRGESLVPPFL